MWILPRADGCGTIALDRDGDASYDARMRSVLLVLALVALPAAAAPPAEPGATAGYPVGVTTLALVDTARARVLPTEVWYPASTDGRDAPARRRPARLVLLAHGFCGFRTNYEYLAIHLARHGFVAAAPDFPGFNRDDCEAGVATGDLQDAPPADLAFVRDVLRAHEQAGTEGLPRIRRGKAGLVGHSLGGLVVLSAAATSPGDYAAVVGLAPAGNAAQADALAAATPRPAVLLVAGSADTTVPLARTETMFAHLLPPRFLVTVSGGTHSGFTDMDARLTEVALARQQALTARYATALFERYLARRRRFARYLPPTDAAAQGTEVELVVR
jgi:predicted dienelactone hydrolase